MDQPNIPPTMRAWTRPSCGPSAKSLKLITNMPTPTISPDSAEILVRVSYVALQYSTETALEIIPQLPGMPVRIPEIEYSGIVVAAGSKAPAELREVGMRVNGFRSISSILLGYGVMCEYVKAMPEKLTRLPDGVGMEMAAGMLGCGSTALKMMRTAGLKGGDRILVNGASSSVGSVLVQMCKANGAFVVGVASGKNEELVRSLGVNEVSPFAPNMIWTICPDRFFSSSTIPSIISQHCSNPTTPKTPLTTSSTVSASNHSTPALQTTSNQPARSSTSALSKVAYGLLFFTRFRTHGCQLGSAASHGATSCSVRLQTPTPQS